MRLVSIFSFGLAVVFACSSTARLAHACPSIDGVPDYNAKGLNAITFLGDSLVSGKGDIKNSDRGGYVLRIAKAFKNSHITNLGKNGQKTGQLIKYLNDVFALEKFSAVRDVLNQSSIIVIDGGRNDRWLFGEPVDSAKNLRIAADLIRKQVKKATGLEPLVVTAVMMLPNRGSQGPWVKELNKFILKSNSTSRPADLRFDLVSKRLLSRDQIHPTSAGYDQLYKTLVRYLRRTLPRRMKALRPDTDGDGISDIVEIATYMTDPLTADTDGDGRSDGAEVCGLDRTDPLVVD